LFCIATWALIGTGCRHSPNADDRTCGQAARLHDPVAASAQTPTSSPQETPKKTESSSTVDPSEIGSRCVQHLLGGQEGENKSEWPYEGVYRVGGRIPVGYRIGGTSICSLALTLVPEYADDPVRQDSVKRAVEFIIHAAKDELMTPVHETGYDVRGWGFTYGALFLLHLKAHEQMPAELAAPAEETLKFFLDAIQKTEIKQVGGWNYARSGRVDAISPPSPFMTGPTLQALFEARRQGYAVDDAVVTRALDSLEASRTPTGAIRYSGIDGDKSREPVPGAVGRMLVTETTLHLAGRSSIANVRSAIDSFIVHWEWLNKRRAQTGTHVPPYNIAPYYFYYAHYYAAQAVEQLPDRERAEYRRRINGLLMSVRLEDGTWNDRVFDRSSNYGTAMATMAILMPSSPAPATWRSEPKQERPQMDTDEHG